VGETPNGYLSWLVVWFDFKKCLTKKKEKKEVEV
jgi:hypothetical protein